nr:transposase [Amycolatopsis rhizosphaerae]
MGTGRRCARHRVTADEAYGGDSKFRHWLEQRRIGYVVAVPSSQTIPAVAGVPRRRAHGPRARGRLETP